MESHATDIVCADFSTGFVSNEYMLKDGTRIGIRTEFVAEYLPLRDLEVLHDRIIKGEAGAEEAAVVLSRVIKKLSK